MKELSVRNTIHSTLDPLLLVLSRDYVDDDDLTDRLRKLFQVRLSNSQIRRFKRNDGDGYYYGI
jgi:hypothetical protein